ERTIRFVATSFEMGEQKLGPYKVSLRSLAEASGPALPGGGAGEATVTAEAITLDVKSLLASIEEKSGETVELASPIKAPMKLEPDYRWVWWVAGGFLGAVFLAAVSAWAIWRFVRRGGMSPERSGPPPLPPAEEALAALKELESRSAVENMPPRLYYNELSYILRRYLERRHRFEALEMTSSEVLDVVQQIGWPRDLYETLRAEMTESDAAKFARYEPPVRRRGVSLESVREIVERTRPSATLASQSEGVEVEGGDSMDSGGGARSDA
ncbi:MAG: hypothetical protein ACOC29_03200, partial [Candidatus Sumerlaeota bacterium]